MKNEQIARICHEVNRAYCSSIGDASQPSWEDAPEWQRDSAVNGVEFHLNNDTTPEQSHENWMKEKVDSGWVYGSVKDPEKKEHPCMVPYDQLPLEQRTKDYLFKAIVDCFK
ncbi:RyR domain-containing protein [Paenibacillus bouchesdurhonensis]|uniref:RyR domain-containing protein n=1 Tax=Paenibacillus bouchesdurhonensis TaxID=1870990 RepID=UPI000DA6250D|nr:RyR domain-containing protein [Paenibacillus bouchesdurhonensis]